MNNTTTAIALSKEAKIVNVVMPDAKMEPAGKINYFHRVTKEAGKLSIAAAFYAGLELMRVKANLTQHGEFQKWVESNCDFTYKTGHNYIHVAYMCLDAAGYDCDELLAGSDKTRVKAIEDATERCESNSLNEIYVDLGIIRKSKSNLGGKREGAGRKRKDAKELAAAAEQAAKTPELLKVELEGMMTDLYRFAELERSFEYLDRKTIEETVKTLDKITKRARLALTNM